MRSITDPLMIERLQASGVSLDRGIGYLRLTPQSNGAWMVTAATVVSVVRHVRVPAVRAMLQTHQFDLYNDVLVNNIGVTPPTPHLLRLGGGLFCSRREPTGLVSGFPDRRIILGQDETFFKQVHQYQRALAASS